MTVGPRFVHKLFAMLQDPANAAALTWNKSVCIASRVAFLAQQQSLWMKLFFIQGGFDVHDTKQLEKVLGQYFSSNKLTNFRRQLLMSNIVLLHRGEHFGMPMRFAHRNDWFACNKPQLLDRIVAECIRACQGKIKCKKTKRTVRRKPTYADSSDDSEYDEQENNNSRYCRQGPCNDVRRELEVVRCELASEPTHYVDGMPPLPPLGAYDEPTDPMWQKVKELFLQRPMKNI